MYYEQNVTVLKEVRRRMDAGMSGNELAGIGYGLLAQAERTYDADTKNLGAMMVRVAMGMLELQNYVYAGDERPL